MSTLAIILLILIIIFGFGGFSHSRWNANGPAWLPNILYILAAVLFIILILNIIHPGFIGFMEAR